MKCPICSIDLVMSERQGIEIDYCPQCRGVWLDRGEIDKIIERSAPAPSGPSPQLLCKPLSRTVRQIMVNTVIGRITINTVTVIKNTEKNLFLESCLINH